MSSLTDSRLCAPYGASVGQRTRLWPTDGRPPKGWRTDDTPVSAATTNTGRTRRRPSLSSHRLPLFHGAHLCCSVPPRAAPIKTKIWNLLRPLRLYFGTVLFFHCTDAKQKNWSRRYILRFHIIRLEELVPETVARGLFLCHLLGNWKSERRGDLVDYEGNKEPVWLHKRHGRIDGWYRYKKVAENLCVAWWWDQGHTVKLIIKRLKNIIWSFHRQKPG